MATIVTRSGKGSPLTNNEVDANFTNLNTDKLEVGGGTLTGALTISSGGLTVGGNASISGNLDVVGQISSFNSSSSSYGAMNLRASEFVFKNAGGTEKVRFNNQGIGVGTSSVDEMITIDGGSAFPAIKWKATTQTSRFLQMGMTDALNYYIEANGSLTNLLFKTAGTTALTLNSSQNATFAGTISSGAISANSGTTNTVATFTSTDAGAGINLTDDSGTSTLQTNGANLRIGVDEDGAVSSSAIQFRVDGSTKATLNSSGRLGIGTTSPLGALHVAAGTDNTVALFKSSDNKASILVFDDDTNTLLDGFIAHEVSSIVPESITGDKDGTQDIGSVKNSEGKVTQENVPKSVVNDLDDGTWTKTGTENIYQSIDQSKLVPLLVKALQEAVTKIETLETSNADLITRVKTLEDA